MSETVELQPAPAIVVRHVVGDAIRVLLTQPSPLAIAVQALVVEGAALWVLHIPSLVIRGGGILAISISLLLAIFAFSGIWGSVVELKGGSYNSLTFFLHGFRYLGRAFVAAFMAGVFMLPAAAFGLLAVGAAFLFGMMSAPPMIPATFVLVYLVWVVNALWASRRLLVVWPVCFASGSNDSGLEHRILRERRGEVTRLWIILLILGIFASVAVVFLVGASEFSLTGGLLLWMQRLMHLRGPEFGQFAWAPLSSVVNLFLVNPTGGVQLSSAGTGNSSGFFLAGALFLVVSLFVWSMLQTLAALAAVGYYYGAGGSAAWFRPGHGPAAEKGTFNVGLGVARKAGEARLEQPRREQREPLSRRIHSVWEGLRQTFSGKRDVLVPITRRAVAIIGCSLGWVGLEVSHFAPLLRGRLFPYFAGLWTAPQSGRDALQAAFDRKSVVAIWVSTYAFLGVAVMTGWGEALVAVAVGGIVGFLFGLLGLRAAAILLRRVARVAKVEIDKEAAEFDLASASAGSFCAALVALVVVLVLRIITGESVIYTGALAGGSVAMMTVPLAALLSERGLGPTPAAAWAGTLTGLILVVWVSLLYIVGSFF